MIARPKDTDIHQGSSWVAGVGAFVLVVGLSGAVTPLKPVSLPNDPFPTQVHYVMIEEFDPPAVPFESTAPAEPEIPQAFEIPPLPQIEEPLRPPEMPDVIEPEPEISAPAPPQGRASTERKTPRPAPRPQSRPQAAGESTGLRGAGESGPPGPPILFTGAGQGRFPTPTYPAAARAARKEGVVRLLVTVGPNGVPGSVGIQASSGHRVLDEAARDHLRRRWRWPAGGERRFIVPIRFVLQ